MKKLSDYERSLYFVGALGPACLSVPYVLLVMKGAPLTAHASRLLIFLPCWSYLTIPFIHSLLLFLWGRSLGIERQCNITTASIAYWANLMAMTLSGIMARGQLTI
jgi:hypothetical protein